MVQKACISRVAGVQFFLKVSSMKLEEVRIEIFYNRTLYIYFGSLSAHQSMVLNATMCEVRLGQQVCDIQVDLINLLVLHAYVQYLQLQIIVTC
jgi:hypothetical protein